MLYKNPSKVELICHCGERYFAREADLKRGWGKSCSKSCAATKRDFGRPNPKRVDGLKLPNKTKKKPRGFRKNDNRNRLSEFEQQERDHERAMFDSSSCHGQDEGDY